MKFKVGDEVQDRIIVGEPRGIVIEVGHNKVVVKYNLDKEYTFVYNNDGLWNIDELRILSKLEKAMK